MTKKIDSDIMTVREAAAYLKKTEGALRNSYKKWKVPHFRYGVRGDIYFRKSTLDRWIAAQEMNTSDHVEESIEEGLDK